MTTLKTKTGQTRLSVKNDRAAAPGTDVPPDPAETEHLAYLGRVEAEGVIPPALAALARVVWAQCRFVAGDALPIPGTSAFDGGPIIYTWDKGDHHLSAYLGEDRPDEVSWFYRNRATGETWGAESGPDGWPPDGAAGRLRRVAG